VTGLRGERARGASSDLAPSWLAAALCISLALVLGQLALEVFVLRPGYGTGDETAQIRLLVGLSQGRPFEWRWAQGSLQRIGLWLWLCLSGSGLRALHVPGLAVLALEALCLWRLARRWFSREAAHWALLADLLCAATWMRGRSILSYQWLPLELLLLALLAGKVKGRWGALLWGACGAFLLLDYEGALVALPGLFMACVWQEEGLRRRWVYALAAMAAVAAMLAGMQPQVVGDYVRLRNAVNLDVGTATLLAAWARNLGQLLAGGRPMPYLGVDRWPAVAAWSLPLLGFGACFAWRKGYRAILFWALSAVLLTQAATAPWGLPSQRLAAAWPALCLLAGAGGAELRRLCPRIPAAAWLALLALGCAAEANAFYRHMAYHGRQVYGRAELLDAAARDARGAQAQGAAVCTALLETRSNDVRFLVDPSGPPAGVGAQEAWVFLPPEFHAVAPSAGQALVYRASFNDVPVLVLRARGAQALRFEAVERDLRPLLDADSAAAERAWLERPAPAGDDWAFAAVLDRHLRRLWEGLPLDQGLARLAASRPSVSPGPLSLLGRYYAARPDLALPLFDAALRVDPLWGPALEDRVTALSAAGRTDEARAAAALRDEGLRQGAWQVYD
jgi:hypothetical protein